MWWGAAVVGVLGAVLLLVAPRAGAVGGGEDVCRADRLGQATVDSTVRIRHRSVDYSRVDVRLRVRVPRSWPAAGDLLLGPDSEPYRAALRCLLLDGGETQPYRWEWRSRQPRVTVSGDEAVVTYEAFRVLDERGASRVGPWLVRTGATSWTLELRKPAALASARWASVRVDLGRAGAVEVSPRTATGHHGTRLTWTSTAHRPLGEVRVRFRPPAARMLAAATSSGSHPLVLLGLAWSLAVVVLTLVVAGRLENLAGAALSPSMGRALTALRVTAYTYAGVIVLAVPDDALYSAASDVAGGAEWTGGQAWHLALACAAGAVVVCGLARARRTVLAAVCGAAVGGGGVATAVTLAHDGASGHTATHVVWLLGAACAALVLAWLLALHTAFDRLRIIGGWRGEADRLALRRGGGVHAVIATAVVVAAVVAAERNWHMRSWLSDRGVPEYGERHRAELAEDLVWFAWSWQDMIAWTAWWFLSLALLAALRVWARRPQGGPLAPGAPERLVIAVFYAVAVAPALGWYAGINLEAVFLAAHLAAVGLLIRWGGRHGVLAARLSDGTPLADALGPGDRERLIGMARRHREAHAKLKRLEQGHSDDSVLRRDRLERHLDEVHRWSWRPPGSAASGRRHAMLPERLSPVDVALAWGPREHWWDNGVRAAGVAGAFGVPATAAMLWMEHLRDGGWEELLHQRHGLVDLVAFTVYWHVSWVGTGFALGVLWRLLPGRRSVTRASVLSAAYALPVAADWLGDRAVAQEPGQDLLGALLVFVVLTLTAMVMDLDTFGAEKRYWPTRAGLLLSVYQMRSLWVQVLLFAAQIVAVITLVTSIGGGEPSPPGMHDQRAP
ncbi:hypothetical protein GCM10027168_10130 [Streptomyces capparidis]